MATNDFQYEIIETVLDLSPKSGKGWVKQLNRVKWGDNAPSWDIRSWHYPEGASSPDKMSKGVALSDEEMNNLRNYFFRFEQTSEHGGSE